MPLLIVSILAALAIVSFGAEFLVSGATKLARRLGLSPLFIGLTIVGFGTSSPEIGASLTATLKGSTDVSVGNVIGSNIFNIAAILGLAAIITPIRMRLKLVGRDLLIATLAAAYPLVALLQWEGNTGLVTRTFGILGLGMLFAWMTIAYLGARASGQNEVELAIEHSDAKVFPRPGLRYALMEVGLLLGGLGMLIFGSKWFVESAVELAEILGMSERVIGLTVVAAGTSLPELVTSVVAARRGNSDLALGNVIGSNIFNAFSILAICAIVKPQTVQMSSLLLDIPYTIGLTLCVALFLGAGQRIRRWQGLLFFASFLAFMTWTIMAPQAS